MADDEKTKDLLIKLQILTNGLIEEKNKSKNYLEKIKELEKMIQKKDDEIILLSKAKFDLEADLTFERSKKTAKQSNKKFTKEMTLEKYEEIINEQGFKLRNLTNQLSSEKELFEQQKTDFQTMLKTQAEQLLSLKESLEFEKKENSDLKIKIENIKEMTKKYEIEKIKYDAQFERYQHDKIEVQNKNLELQEIIDKLRKDNFEKDEQISGLVKKSEEYATRLNDMKDSMVSRQIKPTSFKVELMGKGKKIIEILFHKTEDYDDNLNIKNKYEMLIKGHKKGIDEHINLLDVSEFQIHEKDKNRVDISYTVSNNFYFILFFCIMNKKKIYR